MTETNICQYCENQLTKTGRIFAKKTISKQEYHLSLNDGETLSEKDVLMAKLSTNEIQMGLIKVKSFAPCVWLNIIMMKAQQV